LSETKTPRRTRDPVSGFFWRTQRFAVTQSWVKGGWARTPFHAFGQIPDFDLRRIEKTIPQAHAPARSETLARKTRV